MTADSTLALFTRASVPEQAGRGRTVAERLASSTPANTSRAYDRWQTDYVAWCNQHGVEAVPGTDEVLAEWINHVLNRGRTVAGEWRPLALSTLEQALAAIRTMHREAGYKGQPDTELARRLLRGEARQRAERGEDDEAVQAVPLLVPAIRQILDVTDLTVHKGIRDRALLVIGFGGMLRRSELAGLRIGSITVTDDGLDVRLATSKTDRDSRGTRIPVPRGSHPETCPVRAYEALVAKLAARNAAGPDDPLFRAVDRHGGVRGQLRAADVNRVVTAGAQRASLPNAAGYSGHSPRAGAATAAYAGGKPIEAIRKQGRWAPGSKAMLAYFRAVDRWKDNPIRDLGL